MNIHNHFDFELNYPGCNCKSKSVGGTRERERERCTSRSCKSCATRNHGVYRSTWVQRTAQTTTPASPPLPLSLLILILLLKPFILLTLVSLPKRPKTTPLESLSCTLLNLHHHHLLPLLFAPILLLLLFHSLRFPPLPHSQVTIFIIKH